MNFLIKCSFIIFTTVSLMIACGPSTNVDPITGTWVWDSGSGDETAKIVFKGNGLVTFSGEAGEFRGTYTLNGDLVECVLSEGSDELLLKDGKLYMGGSYPVVFRKKGR